MTVQERPQAWGQGWQDPERRPQRPARDVLDFATWTPLFLTPRLINRQPQRRSWFVVGGCGFMLLFGFLYLMALFCVAMVVLEWDMFVFVAYGLTWLTVRPVRAIKARRAA